MLDLDDGADGPQMECPARGDCPRENGTHPCLTFMFFAMLCVHALLFVFFKFVHLKIRNICI